MKKLDLKVLAISAFVSISGILNAQWNPLWYPAPGFAAMANDASIADAVPWAVGGNQVTPMSFLGSNNYRIGTTDGSPFELMASGIEMIHMDQASRVAIGANFLPSVPNCVLDIRGQGSHFRIFGDASGNVEATEDLKMHYGSITNGFPYRFELNQGSPGGSVPRFSIDAFGLAKVYHKMDIGANMIVGTGARLGVDGTSSDGVVIVGNNGNNGNGNKALLIANTAGAPRMKVWVNAGGGDDTKFHMAGSTQIGFYQSPGGLVDNSTRLNVEAYGPNNGVKVTTNTNWIKAIVVDNSNFGALQPFVVFGTGRLDINQVAGVGQAEMNINTTSANALDVFDGANVNFRVKNTGFVFCRELQVQVGAFPDYVFSKDYNLMPLSQVEQYIKDNKHLPGFEKGESYEANGIKTSEMFVKQQEKIEELMLYVIELKKEVEALKNK